MQSRTIISKKNEDGSYDTNEYLFDGIDLYHGDRTNKKLEISPVGAPVKNVSIQLVCTRDNIEYEFKPEEDNEYNLKCDKNGVIRIINILTIPLDFFIFVEAEPYTVKKISETNVLDDINLIVWSN